MLVAGPLACASTPTELASPPPPPAPQIEARHWTDGGVVYGVVPSLFGDPPLQAVTERIDELVELGVDALWLSPVTATTDPDDFGYAVTDYFAVRDDFGTAADMKALVERAHAHDIEVIIDFVPNHTSVEHPWLDDPARADWYDRGPDGAPTHYFDWEHLPNLDYDNPAVTAMMTGALAHWMETYGVDGFRLDAAWGMKERTPGAWPKIAADLRARDPDLFLLAEASARDPYWFAHGFDAAYDWTQEIGRWAWADVFETADGIAARIDAALGPTGVPDPRVARFLNNNDTGPRFVTRHGPATTRVAATLLLTLPGLPVVYTGDEVGAEYEPYAPHVPLAWTDPHGLRPHYRRLIALREALPALRGDVWTRVRTEPSSAYAYMRHEDDGSDPVLVVLNFGDATEVELTFPDVARTLDEGTLRDALTDAEVPLDWRGSNLAHLAMPARTSRVLVPEIDGPRSEPRPER